MTKAIFSDSDLSVRLKAIPNKGVQVELMCQTCELPYILMHNWAEVRAMLEGRPVPGVEMKEDGFEVKFQCSNLEDMCTQVNTYRISHEELEAMAQSEVSRKQRLQGGVQPPRVQQTQRGQVPVQRQGPPRR
jgi:hypothetical protein